MGRLINKGPSTVSEMKRRGRIDVVYWPALCAAADDAETASRDKRDRFVLTNDMLVEAHTVASDSDEAHEAAA